MRGISTNRATSGFSMILLHRDNSAVTWLNVFFIHDDPIAGSEASSSHTLTHHHSRSANMFLTPKLRFSQQNNVSNVRSYPPFLEQPIEAVFCAATCFTPTVAPSSYAFHCENSDPQCSDVTQHPAKTSMPFVTEFVRLCAPSRRNSLGTASMLT